MLLLLVGWHIVLTVVTAVLTPRLGPKTFLIAALGPLAGVGVLAASAGDVLAGRAWTETTQWVPGLDLALTMRLDGLSWVMLVLVSGVGSVIFGYTAWYAHRDATLTRFVATLTAFAGAMVGLVLADDVLLLYVFWELTSVTSFLLVGLKTDDAASRRAALQALLITMLGGLAMLVGLLTLAQVGGSTDLSTLLAFFDAGGPGFSTTVQVGLALVLVGALTKSAQVPFHIWLPGAMAAPTPVSAYLHAAAMVKAGVYLIARLSPTFHELPWWRPVLVGFGVATMLVGGYRALRQHDLKRLLAFSTVSQLGLLTVAAGWGSPLSAAALVLLLLAHGFAKAALFMSLGAVDHQAGTRDLRELSGLARAMPTLAVAAGLACASMAGVVLLLGFIAKEELLAALLEQPYPPAFAAAAGVGIGSALTCGYALRYWWGAFGTKKLGPHDPDARPTGVAPLDDVDAPAAGLTAPVVLLAVASLATGVFPMLLDRPVAAATGEPVHLALWHGFNLPLAISAAALAAGAALFVARPVVFRLQDRLAGLTDPADADLGYDRILHGVDRLAAAATGRTQVGSLPAYLGVIIVVAVAMPGTALLLNATPWPSPPWWGEPAHLPIVGVIAVAALLACLTRTRLTAVLMLGAAGYGVAGLYAIQGAPDLALTQLLVETLSLVVFLFVLRLLPRRFPRTVGRGRDTGKWVVALSVGVMATALTLLATNPNRTTEVGPSVAEPMLRDSYPLAHGRNVVNVILVDFRGLDTLGEATVVLVAALGIASLVLTARRRPDQRSLTTQKAQKQKQKQTEPSVESQPSLLLRVAVRVTFHPILAVALFLLFSGHNNPGGGFIAGLVAGCAFLLRYLAGDVPRASTPLRPVWLLGLGLTLAAGTAVAPTLFGTDLLTSGYSKLSLPLLGDIGLTSVLVFDTGVFCVVVGLTLVVLDTLGSRAATSLGVVEEEVTL